jgi:hypothetical protein
VEQGKELRTVSLVIAVTCEGNPGAITGLEAELSSRGASVEVLIPERQPDIPPGSIPAAAAMLARHGVVVLTSGPIGACEAHVVQTSEEELLDPVSRSAFLRRLELSGLIPPESGELSGDEEAVIRERLQKLGYL